MARLGLPTTAVILLCRAALSCKLLPRRGGWQRHRGVQNQALEVLPAGEPAWGVVLVGAMERQCSPGRLGEQGRVGRKAQPGPPDEGRRKGFKISEHCFSGVAWPQGEQAPVAAWERTWEPKGTPGPPQGCCTSRCGVNWVRADHPGSHSLPVQTAQGKLPPAPRLPARHLRQGCGQRGVQHRCLRLIPPLRRTGSASLSHRP